MMTRDARGEHRSARTLSYPFLVVLALMACGEARSDAGASQVGPGRDAAADTGGSGGLGGAIGAGAGAAAAAPGEGGIGGQTPLARPPAPPWQPHFDLAAPGWRQSTEPLCTELFGGMGQAVWSDEGAVFALVSAFCNPLADIQCGGEGMALYRNEGTGWTLFHEFEPHFHGYGSPILSGFVGGDLVVSDLCGISFISREGSSRCTGTAADPDTSIMSVRTAGSHAYALAGHRVLQYDGASQWDLLATLPVDPTVGAAALWAGNSSLMVSGSDQLAVRIDSTGTFESLPGVPAGDYWAVWASDTEVWLGNTVGQLVRFDGDEWTIIETGMASPIRGLWSSPEGALYFYGGRNFGRWDGSAVERFAVDPGENLIRFSGMWGNDANEVFLSVIDGSFRDYQCSGTFMLYFDGAEFHQF
jgi:hypothetical protein